MAKIASLGSHRVIKTTTTKGRQYAVEFDETGEIVCVSAMFRRGCDYRTQHRQIWHRRSGRPMSIASACAGRAALKDLAERAAKAKV